MLRTSFVIAFHSLTVLSPDADASSAPLGENATLLTQFQSPSRLSSSALQLFCTPGSRRTHRGTLLEKAFRIALAVSVNKVAEKCNYSAVIFLG